MEPIEVTSDEVLQAVVSLTAHSRELSRQFFATEQRFWNGFKKVTFDLLQRASEQVTDTEWQKEYQLLKVLA